MTMQLSDEEWAPIPRVGCAVVGIDGGRIGSVVDVGQDYILVAIGLFSARDRYIPRSLIVLRSDDLITLSITRSEVERSPFGIPK